MPMSSNTHQSTHASKLQGCEEVLEYQFRDRQLLETCLTHASISKTRLASNERLEFLGDAILGAIVCEMLYHRFPEFPEGELTRVKSVLVSRNTCAEISEDLGLDAFLILGKGVSSDRKLPLSISAAVVESLVAGIYLDGGREAAERFIHRVMEPLIELVAQPEDTKNFKSLLQQLSQKIFDETPLYRLLDEKGPDHSKCFNIAAVIGSQSYSSAWGPSKKEAEQLAAQNALREIQDAEAREAIE